MAKGFKSGGRVAGTLNRATAEIKALAGQYSEMAVRELARLAEEAESEQARVAACNALLDRAHGKPSQALTGPDGEKLIESITVTFVNP